LNYQEVAEFSGGGVIRYKSTSYTDFLVFFAVLCVHKTFILHPTGQRPVSNSVGHRPTENDTSHSYSPDRVLAIQSANALSGRMLSCAFPFRRAMLPLRNKLYAIAQEAFSLKKQQ
jgi:hypothetical protein